MKIEVLMELIDKAANDEKVKTDEDLSSGLMWAYKELDNGKSIKIVTRKLDDILSMYLITHSYQAPRVIIDLIKFMKKDSDSFWKGTGITNLFY